MADQRKREQLNTTTQEEGEGDTARARLIEETKEDEVEDDNRFNE